MELPTDSLSIGRGSVTTLTGSMTSPSVTVVASLKLKRIRPTKFNTPKKSLIRLKAGSYNKSALL